MPGRGAAEDGVQTALIKQPSRSRRKRAPDCMPIVCIHSCVLHKGLHVAYPAHEAVPDPQSLHTVL